MFIPVDQRRSGSLTLCHAMHVLFLPKWYPGRHDPQLGDFLRKQAMGVSGVATVSVLYICGMKGPLAVDQDDQGMEGGLWELRCYYKASEHPIAPVRKLINAVRHWRRALEGWQHCLTERGRPDLVHVHILNRPALLALWLKWRYGIPYLISEQSSEYMDGTFSRKGPLSRWLSRWLIARANGVTAVSAHLGERLKELGLVQRYDVVPNVIPGTDRTLPPKGEAGHFLVVADLVDRTKNVSGVLRAFAKFRSECPGSNLTIIGDGPDRAALEQLAGELGVSNAVTFLGRLANTLVIDHMAHTGAVIINSNIETFSVVTGEALAQGKPVIATRCGGPVAFVTPENGLLIPVGDDQALTAAMLEIVRDWTRYDPAQIRASVHDKFSPDAVGRAFLKVYQRICDGQRP